MKQKRESSPKKNPKKTKRIEQAHCDRDGEERGKLREALDVIVYQHLDTIQELNDCSSPRERKEYLAKLSDDAVLQIDDSLSKITKALQEIAEKGMGLGGKYTDKNPRGFALWLSEAQQKRYGTLGCNLRGRDLCKEAGLDSEKRRRMLEALELRLLQIKEGEPQGEQTPQSACSR